MKRGELFMFGLNIMFLICIILIFWKLNAAFVNANPAEGLGTRQTAVLGAYATSEQMLLYIDEAAKFASYDALALTMGDGGVIGNGQTVACSTYAGYDLWYAGGTSCFPSTVAKDRANVYAGFTKVLSANLRQKLKYPGIPFLPYEYALDTTDGLRVTGIAQSVIRLPILAVKGDSQSKAAGIILNENLIAAQDAAFTKDSPLVASTIRSPNRKQRAVSPAYIIIGSTGTADTANAIEKFTASSDESVHYLIDETGQIIQLVPEKDRAFHLPPCEENSCALDAVYSREAIEESSISISLVNAGVVSGLSIGGVCRQGLALSRTSWCGGGAYPGLSEATCTGELFAKKCWAPYAPAQIAALQALTTDIAARRNMAPKNILFLEQVRYTSSSPGPALGIDRNGAVDQKALLQTLVQKAAESIAKKAATEEAGETTPREESSATGTVTSVGWPVSSNILTSYFGERELLNRTVHKGLDFAAAEGIDDILAIADGTVELVQLGCPRQCGTATQCPRGCSFGNMVLIRHTDALYARYAHLSTVFVKKGDVVRKGQALGKAGATGSVTGPHLHLEVYQGNPSDGAAAVDPLCIFPDEVLQGKRTTGAQSCKFASLSHEDPVLAKACLGVSVQSSVPACAINMQLGGKADATLKTTLENIDKVAGLREAIDEAARKESVDPRLVIAVIAQESTGRPDLVSATGCQGIGQICLASAPADIFGSNIPACVCPRKINLKTGKEQSMPCHASEANCQNSPLMDPIKSVAGIARIIREKQSNFLANKDKALLTIAAYNGGEGTIKLAMKRTGAADPSWPEVASRIDADLIYQSFCVDTKSLCANFDERDEQERKAGEIKGYVERVAGFYAQLGGSAASAFGDQVCEGIAVKELGSYTFNTSFRVMLPDLLTRFDRASELGKRIVATCNGVAGGDDNAACIRQQLASFGTADLSASLCTAKEADDVNTSIFLSLAETIQDCKNNLQQNCTCSWTPPQQFDAKQVIIEFYNDEFMFYVDGEPMQVEPLSLNQHGGEPSSLYLADPRASPRTAAIRYVFTYANKFLSDATLEVADAGGVVKKRVDQVHIYRVNDDVAYTPNAAQVCGMYKTSFRVCIDVQKPLYSFSKAKAIDPVLRFALRLDDKALPAQVSNLLIEKPSLSAEPAQSPESVLQLSFTPSSSRDVSYYKVRCALSSAKFSEHYVFAEGRNRYLQDEPRTGKQIIELDDCDGASIVGGSCLLPGVPVPNPLGCYKVSVTPVDMAGNEGVGTVYDQLVAAASGQ